ncbi:bifunctional biotin--[acetyl-CoA-carboxylase] ligase/biotin operon repressor BirA [Necropsobacter massiliensis]|uniref:bifunctional biotin--[acetyl-CoA-carboxylase] ligase/biotin operon repressor BirA n=1 Tax=Necropsobacter massiliensis TaxID=1400001 RepID=UPI000595A949|nr:bifunctional biotin--[acetyl-CoA-carboxylase] ligase/biotin operon repressor BirA [Necropsobacter massiliensis]
MDALLMLLADGKTYSYQKLTALLGKKKKMLCAEIDALRAQGLTLLTDEQSVRLQPQMALLDGNRLIRELSPYRVMIRPIINSTNQFLLDRLSDLQKGDLCLAEYQSAGRGRRGRQWRSPFAGQVILSFYWTLAPEVSLNGLSLVIGIAIVDTLKELGAEGVELKWPNDVLLQGRKLAGILVEIANNKNGLIHFIVGIGMNLSIPAQDNRIDQPWAELTEVLPQVDRNELIIRLVNTLYTYLALFQQQGIAFFRQRWLELDHFLDEQVNIITAQQVITGIEQGIDDEGYLLLSINNGENMLRFNAGEVSLRKA